MRDDRRHRAPGAPAMGMWLGGGRSAAHRWLGWALLALGLASGQAQAQAAEAVDQRLDRLDAQYVRLDAQNIVLDGKIDQNAAVQNAKIEALDAKIDALDKKIDAKFATVNFVMAAGFGFLGLVILFQFQRNGRRQQEAIEKAVHRAVERALAQQGGAGQRVG